MICPFTAKGFSALPQSCAAQTLSTLVCPVSTSTLTSATYAEKEYAGANPAAAPL